MAIKPNDGETFLREVDEELRRERVNRLFARYGWAIAAAILLVLGAIGGFIWWQNRQFEQAEAQGETLAQTLDELESGNRDAALPKVDQLAASDIEGYRAAALFARATAQSEAGRNDAAIATLRSIVADEDFAEPYRQAALIRQTELEYDRLTPQQVIQRLGPLARPGSAWFGSAGEMVGIAHMRMNRPDLAAPLFAGIARDQNVPPSIRTRAIQMAGGFGINAMPDQPAVEAAPAAGQPVPGAAEEKAE